ncbi:Uma2 family endonuclease [Streptomyces brevispora]|uniref:Uma2 family endonuclease n=1 Tax=Streptomyces brevispora TaxID=887462 RepID=A0ABZ1G4D5_9ACTN|nr:Uma2 family endonuclease [Streptomyces brevispora]WSC14082.1 Uma2 family endonuclease [Streptomyces brevispora]
MCAAAVEHPCDGEPDRPERPEPESLLESANRLSEQLPGHRVEIIGGVITVAPSPDGAHANALTSLMIPFLTAGLHGGESKVLQAVGVWLPSGSSDYAIPDLAVVDADFDEHVVENNCYDPAAFRLVLEVTSGNYQNDLRNKVAAYANAKIPVYVILDRKHGRVHVLTEPLAGGYDTHQVYAPGHSLTLPDSIGAEVALDVTALVAAGRPRPKPKPEQEPEPSPSPSQEQEPSEG